MRYQRHIFLPHFRACTLTYLQELMSDTKYYFFDNVIHIRKTPPHNEFSTKVILDLGLLDNELIVKYFPKDPEHVDKTFLWSIWYAWDEVKAQEYFDSVMKNHAKEKKLPPPKTIHISDEWIEALLKHDVIRK
jgi:hypothetical protein